MKKFIAAVLACMVLAFAVVGCASAKPSDEAPAPATSTTEPAVDTTSSSEAATLANPLVESDADTILNTLGLTLGVPEGAEDVKYFILSGDTAQINFKKDGETMTVRAKSADALEDISGMYYDWTVSEDCEVAGRPGKTMKYIGENESVEVCLWYDVVPGILYSLSVESSDLDGFDIIAVAEQVFVPMQGDAE